MAEEKKVIGRPFQKGQSGNPAGRAKREVEKSYLKRLHDDVSLDDWGEIIAVAILQAKKGDKDARKWLGDYLLGTPVQRTEVTGPEGGPVAIKRIIAEIPSESLHDQS